MTEEILRSPDLRLVDPDQRAQTLLLVGIGKFITEKVPYFEVKEHLKNALLEAEGKSLKGTIAHNLAVINYCEIQDHNDRLHRDAGGELGQYMRSGQADEELEKDIADKVR